MGQSLTKRFGNTWIKRWNVFNIDSQPNPLCKHNFIIDFNEPISQRTILDLHEEVKKAAPEIDAMINVVSAPKQDERLKISDIGIF